MLYDTCSVTFSFCVCSRFFVLCHARNHERKPYSEYSFKAFRCSADTYCRRASRFIFRLSVRCGICHKNIPERSLYKRRSCTRRLSFKQLLGIFSYKHCRSFGFQKCRIRRYSSCMSESIRRNRIANTEKSLSG